MNEEPIDSELDEEVARFRASRLCGVASAEPSHNLTQRVMDAVAEEALRESVRAHVTEREPSPDLTRRIMGAVADEAERERRRARWLRAAGAAAAAAVVIAFAIESKVESRKSEVDDAGETLVANPADEAADAPGDDDDEGRDPRWDLVRQLVEYKRYKDAATKLQEKEFVQQNVFAPGGAWEI